MYSQPDDETKYNNNNKAAQDTQQLPWVQETFMRDFPTKGWQAVFLKAGS